MTVHVLVTFRFLILLVTWAGYMAWTQEGKTWRSGFLQGMALVLLLVLTTRFGYGTYVLWLWGAL